MSCIRSCYDKDSSNFGHNDCPTCIHKDAPPQRTWVGLTEEEIRAEEFDHIRRRDFARAIEAKLKEKNT